MDGRRAWYFGVIAGTPKVSGIRGQGSGIRDQGSGVGGRWTEDRGPWAQQAAPLRPWRLTPDPRPLIPDPWSLRFVPGVSVGKIGGAGGPPFTREAIGGAGVAI